MFILDTFAKPVPITVCQEFNFLPFHTSFESDKSTNAFPPPFPLFNHTHLPTRVERPSKERHESEIEKINDEMKKLEQERAAVIKKIEQTKEATKDSPLGAARAEWQELKAVKSRILNERKVIFDRRDQLKAQTESLINDAKKAKGAIKYTKTEDIEKRMKELRRKQETTSMSLSDEKKLVKEIEELSASKKVVAQLSGKEDNIANSKLAAKDISGAIAEKNQALKEINAKLDEKKVVLDSLNETENTHRNKIPDLVKEKNNLSKARDKKYSEIRKLRDEFKKNNNEWYAYKKVVQARKKLENEEEKKRREAEKAAWLAEKEAEELKKTPYEEEMALCEYLANYLSTTYLNASPKEKQDEEKAAPAIKDDPFAGMVPKNKKTDDVFLQMGGTKKGVAGKKKEPKKPVVKAFNLSIDTFDQFALLNLSPPTSIDQVEGSVKDLKDKKEWYSEQPRGSVPTANDIRKAQQKASGKQDDEPAVEGEVKEKKEKKSKKAFVFSNDDFAPLGDGVTMGASVSNWGKKEATVEE